MKFEVLTSNQGITSIKFCKNIKTESNPDITKQLNEYLLGDRVKFDVRLDLHGTSFQLKVWDALRHVPYGKTATYQEIAKQIGMPNAVRAVANAIGANPVAIIIPCHRIIRSDGSLGGYHWGVELKKYLLKLEARNTV